MKHAEVDVVVVGMGWAGGIIAAELTKAGLSVVGLERGPDRRGSDDPANAQAHDELRFDARNDLVQNTAKESWTLRHDLREAALPFRYAGAWRPGEQVGGSGIAWGGRTERFTPYEFAPLSETIERCGKNPLPVEYTLQDLPITYNELEPYFTRFEEMAGVGGKAGNIEGVLIEGGNPFEGPRSREYPLPPHRPSLSANLYAEVARGIGLHPFPMPSANLSRPYTNPDGVTRGACTYGGFCHAYNCATGAKAMPQTTVIPVAERFERFKLRPMSTVFNIPHKNGRAVGVQYYDAAGRIHEQPAAVVVLAAYCFNNVRLLLLSGLGEPYDPVNGTGLVGKNFCNQPHGGATAWFKDKKFNSFMGVAGGGVAVADYAPENLNAAAIGFVGGCSLGHNSPGATPIKMHSKLPPGTPRFGVEWKNAIRFWYDRSMSIGATANNIPHRQNYLDLDPTYRDTWGLPLIRVTFNWTENDRRAIRWISTKLEQICEALGADIYHIRRQLGEHFDSVQYQGTHNTGGAIMGDNPKNSVVNRHCQMWGCHNVFVVGGSALPQNSTHGPTAMIGALAYATADAIALRYAERQELLA